LARERYGLGFGTTMGTLQTTFKCWGQGEPSSDMSDDSDGDGEMANVRGVSLGEWEEGRYVLAWERGDNWSIVLLWLYG